MVLIPISEATVCCRVSSHERPGMNSVAGWLKFAESNASGTVTDACQWVTSDLGAVPEMLVSCPVRTQQGLAHKMASVTFVGWRWIGEMPSQRVSPCHDKWKTCLIWNTKDSSLCHLPGINDWTPLVRKSSLGVLSAGSTHGRVRGHHWRGERDSFWQDSRKDHGGDGIYLLLKARAVCGCLEPYERGHLSRGTKKKC